MLAPRPPVSVARRREVAAAVVAHRQATSIGPGHVLVVAAPPPAAGGHCRVSGTPPKFEGCMSGEAPLDSSAPNP